MVSCLLSLVFIIFAYLVAQKTRNFPSYIFLLSHINTQALFYFIQKIQVFVYHASGIEKGSGDGAVNKTKPCSPGAYILIVETQSKHTYLYLHINTYKYLYISIYNI